MSRIILFILSFSLTLLQAQSGFAQPTIPTNTPQKNTVAYLSLNNKQHIKTDLELLQQYLAYISPKLDAMQKGMDQLPEDVPHSQLKIKVKNMQRLIEKVNAQLDALPIQSHEVFDAIQLLKKSNNLGLGISQEALNIPIDMEKVNQMVQQAAQVHEKMAKQMKYLTQKTS